jgi:hypothetical protein
VAGLRFQNGFTAAAIGSWGLSEIYNAPRITRPRIRFGNRACRRTVGKARSADPEEHDMRDDATHHHQRRDRRRTRLRRAGPPAALLACLIVLTAACGSGSPSSGSAAGSPGGSAKGSPLAYSRCMRTHGISHFPDPNAQGDLSISAGPGTGIDPNSPQYKAADQACRSLMPGNNLSPAQQATARAAALRYSQCMRTHGIPDFPDPNSQGGIGIKVQPGSDLDPNNPRFKAANSTCQHLMPGGGKSGSLTTSGGGS